MGKNSNRRILKRRILKRVDGGMTLREAPVQLFKRVLIPTGALIEKLAANKYFMLIAGLSSVLGLLIALPTLKAQYQSWSLGSLYWKSEYVNYVMSNADILEVLETNTREDFLPNLFPIDFSDDPLSPFWRDFSGAITQYDQVAVNKFQQDLESLIGLTEGQSNINKVVPEALLYYLFMRYKEMQHLYLGGDSDALLHGYVKLLSSFAGAAARIQSTLLCRTIALQYDELIDLGTSGGIVRTRFQRVYAFAHVGYVNVASAFPETSVLKVWGKLLRRFDDIVLANPNYLAEAVTLAKYKKYIVAQLLEKRGEIVGLRAAIEHFCSFGLRCEESGMSLAASFVRLFCSNFAAQLKTDSEYRTLLEDMLQFFLKMSTLTAEKKRGDKFETACGMADICRDVGDESCMHIINGFAANLNKEKLDIFEHFRSNYFIKTGRYLLPQCPESL